MSIFFTVLYLISWAEAFDVCKNNKVFCSNKIEAQNEECNTETYAISNSECSTINFDINKNINELNDVKLQMSEDGQLSIVMNNIKWKKTYLKLANYTNKDKFSCKMFAINAHMTMPLTTEIVDTCFLSSTLPGHSYELNLKAENKQDIQTILITFYKPEEGHFGTNVDIQNRSIFSYVDYTDNYYLKLRIQPLPKNYSISFYKVQVFRTRDKKSEIVESETFLGTSDFIEFDYYTYNEVGDYYFAITAGSDLCQDRCFTTMTPVIHISRKSTALVIGIVGASLIIPFVLFLFHLVNKKCRQNGELILDHQKIVFIFKSSTKLHREVIDNLAKVIQDSTGSEVILEAFKHSHEGEKICSDDILYASHVIYIPPPKNDNPYCEIDFMTYNFLKDELNKKKIDKIVATLKLPYSNNEIPDILKQCRSFLLMDEFDTFLKIFDVKRKFGESPAFLDLTKSIEAAKNETEMKYNLNPPKIIITEQSDGSDLESDGLL